MLDLNTLFFADLLGHKLVAVSETASEPELGAGVGGGIVVPPHHVVSARSRIQGVTATVLCGWRRKQEAQDPRRLNFKHYQAFSVCDLIDSPGPEASRGDVGRGKGVGVSVSDEVF